MAKKNKPLNVGGFMQEVKNNQPTKNEEFPEKNKEVTVPESTQSSVVDDGGRKLDPVVQPVEEMSAQETKPESKKVSRDSQADVAKERKSTQIKKQLGKKLFIPGHHYQKDEVIQFADAAGDSLQLAQKHRKFLSRNRPFRTRWIAK